MGRVCRKVSCDASVGWGGALRHDAAFPTSPIFVFPDSAVLGPQLHLNFLAGGIIAAYEDPISISLHIRPCIYSFKLGSHVHAPSVCLSSCQDSHLEDTLTAAFHLPIKLGKWQMRSKLAIMRSHPQARTQSHGAVPFALPHIWILALIENDTWITED